MRFLSSFLLFVLVYTGHAQDTTQQITPGRYNSTEQQKKPYVILISADGFRHDFAEKYEASNLLSLRKEGVTAKYMSPSFPSLTFPNHYTIVTGMYPAHHGLVDNSFYDLSKNQVYGMHDKQMVADPYWYGGIPLWVLAEQQQMLSASFYWVASEAPIQGTPPTYYYYYNEKIGIDERITAIQQWLSLPEKVRPHFISFYFPEVDHAAHSFGPDSKETQDAVKFVDESIGRLNAVAKKSGLPVNFVFVADHGMAQVDYKNTIPYPKLDADSFIINSGSAVLQVYAKEAKSIEPLYHRLQKEAKDYDVYLKKDVPDHLHYNIDDDKYDRIGDIILLARLPKIFSKEGKPTSPGKHGYDPSIPDMRASFQAWGPAFKKGLVIPGFENIHVYPMIADVLQLQYNPLLIDGKPEILNKIKNHP